MCHGEEGELGWGINFLSLNQDFFSFKNEAKSSKNIRIIKTLKITDQQSLLCCYQRPISIFLSSVLMQTSSNGRHSVRISGLSTIDFRAGFSRKPTMDFKKTSSRPVQGQWGQSFQIVKKKRHCSCWTFALHLSSSLNSCSSGATVNQLCFKCHVNFFVFLSGIPTHILINTTGLSPLARPDRLELLSVSGEVIKTLPIGYFPERKPYGLWNITEFIPPKEAFFLRVTGFDQDGYLFQRVSSVSFSSIIPGQSVMENMIFWMKIWASLC